MSREKPVPNLIRFGLGNGFIGAETSRLFLGGSERYDDEAHEIELTDDNRNEVVAVLRKLADFIEALAPSSSTT